MKRLLVAIAGALAPFLFAPAFAAGTAEEMAAIFGARESLEDASLSPSGSKIAYLAPIKGQGSALFVAPLDGKTEPKAILVAEGDPDRLAGCRWAAETRLVCTTYGVTQLGGVELAYFSRQVALDDDGGNMKILEDRRGGAAKLGYNLYGGSVIDWLPDEDGSVLMERNFVPEGQSGTLLARSREGLAVVRVDTRSAKSDTVEVARRTAAGYITDGRGYVRVMEIYDDNSAGYLTGTIQ